MRGADAEPMFEEAQGDIGTVLHGLIYQCWDAWDSASSAGISVDGSMPILYFGDLLAYQNWPLRVDGDPLVGPAYLVSVTQSGEPVFVWRDITCE